MAIDVTDAPEVARRGDFVTLIGGELDSTTSPRAAGTIGLRGADQPRPALSPDLPGGLRPNLTLVTAP